MSALSDYYIYYKVAPETSADLIPVAVAMQSDIFRLTGIRGRLNRKTGDPNTWMEIYEGVLQRLLFEAALADCVARFGMEKYLVADSVRHSEIFHDPLA